MPVVVEVTELFLGLSPRRPATIQASSDFTHVTDSGVGKSAGSPVSPDIAVISQIGANAVPRSASRSASLSLSSVAAARSERETEHEYHSRPKPLPLMYRSSPRDRESWILSDPRRLPPVQVTLQVVVTGLAAGGVYGLVAIGFSLVFRLTGTIYLAFGDLIGLGVFTTLLVAAGTGPVTQTNVPCRRLRPRRGAGSAGSRRPWPQAATCSWSSRSSREARRWAGSCGTLALAFGIHALLDSVFPRPAYVFPDPIPFRRVGESGFVTVAGASVQAGARIVAAVALVLALIVAWVVDRTRVGRGLQAIAADAEGARIVGVPATWLVPARLRAGRRRRGSGRDHRCAERSCLRRDGNAPRRQGSGGRPRCALRLAVLAFAAGSALGLLEAAIATSTSPGPSRPVTAR